MASSIMHLAITARLLRQRRFSDPERLQFGSILPDACVRGNGHLKIALPEAGRHTYDLARFRRDFGARMCRDDLYLGYYLHLLQDLSFRHFLYELHSWSPYPPGNLQQLYRDYAITNPYLIRTYRLSGDIAVPPAFDAEPIHTLGTFDAGALLASLRAYFQPPEPGSAVIFTAARTEDYLRRAEALCLWELEAMDRGAPLLDGPANAWRDPPRTI